MPIPASDQALLRGIDQTVKPRINMFPAEVVATATVFETPTTYPIGSVEVSNISVGWDDIRVGMLFEIRETTGELVTYGVVRLDPTDETLYIDGKSRGDAGRAQGILRAIAAGQDIVIYSYQPLWSLLSRIFQGVFYKKYDVAYTDEGSNPEPVINLGEWKQVNANFATGRGQVTLSSSGSFSWLNRVILGTAWTTPEDAVFISGTETSETITVELDAGFYIFYCTITDSSGQTASGMRPVWINHPTLYPSLDQQHAVEIEGDTQTMEGRTLNFKVYGDIPESEILVGTAFLLTVESTFDGQSLSSGVEVNNFAGFMSTETATLEFVEGQKALSFEVKSPYLRFQDLPMVSQAIVEASSPSDWTEVSIGLATPDFIGYYILKHHTTFMGIFDYDPLQEEDEPRKRNWGLNGSVVSDYLVQVGQAVGGYIGSRSSGAIVVRRDPMIEEQDYRDDLDERITWTADDFSAPIEIPKPVTPEVGQLKAFAFAYTGTTEPVAVASVAPGFVQGQASGKQDEQTILVGDPDTAQDKINRVSGHYYAKRNNPMPEIQTQFVRNMDVFDPALALWHRLSIDPKYDPRGTGIYTRAIPKSVDRAWDKSDEGAWLKNITTTFEPETYGQPGETYNLETGGGSIYPPFQPPGLEGGNFPDDSLIDFNQFNFVLTWTSFGDVGITKNGFNWSSAQPEMVTSDMNVDWSSPYISSGFTSGSLGIWAVGTNSDQLRVYYTDNILDKSVTWQLKHTFTTDLTTVGSGARILTYRGDSNYIFVCWRDRGGVKYGHSSDAGATWITTVGIKVYSNVAYASLVDADNDYAPLGADIDTDGGVLLSGFVNNVPTNKYGAMYIPKASTGHGTLVSGAIESDSPYVMVKVDRSGDAYVGLNESTILVSPQAEVDWNTSTFTNVAVNTIEGSVQEWPDKTITKDPNIINTIFPSESIVVEVYPPSITDGTVISTTALSTLLEMPLTIDNYFFQPVEMDIYTLGKWNVSQVSQSFQKWYIASYWGTDVDETDDVFQGGVYQTFFEFKFYDNLDNLLYEDTLYTYTADTQIDSLNLVFSPELNNVGRINIRTGIRLEEYNINDLYRITSRVVSDWGTLNVSPNPFVYLGLIETLIDATTATTITPKLYHVDAYKGSAVFTDIRPDSIWSAFYHYGLAVDRAQNTLISLVGTNTSGVSIVYFTSNNRGVAWDAIGFASYIGVVRQADATILFGPRTIDISTDGGVTTASILGDFEDVMPNAINNGNSAGTFRGAISSSTIG